MRACRYMCIYRSEIIPSLESVHPRNEEQGGEGKWPSDRPDLHLIVTVQGLLQPVALRQLLVELCTRHPAVGGAAWKTGKVVPSAPLVQKPKSSAQGLGSQGTGIRKGVSGCTPTAIKADLGLWMAPQCKDPCPTSQRTHHTNKV